MSLISPESTPLLWAVIIGLAAFGFWAEQNTRLGKMMTGIIFSMMVTIILANLKIIPTAAPVYDTIFSRILPLAIPLLLFRANIRAALRDGGPTLWAFGIGSAGVVLGVFIAVALVPLGDLKAVTAGLITATYTGGSANMAAVAIATNFNQGAELTSMIAADIIATNIQTMVLIALPGLAFINNIYGRTESTSSNTQATNTKPFVLKDLNMAGACIAVALAFLLVAIGDAVADMAGIQAIGVLVTSALALLIANLAKPLVELLSGDFEIGTFLIFLFLIAVASGADVWVLAETGPVFFIFVGIVLTVHTAFLLLVARLLRPWLKLDIRSLVIGSTACVGGVTTASAIASAKGWRDLIVPGIMAGTLGTAVGSFLGVWIWSLLK